MSGNEGASRGGHRGRCRGRGGRAASGRGRRRGRGRTRAPGGGQMTRLLLIGCSEDACELNCAGYEELYAHLERDHHRLAFPCSFPGCRMEFSVWQDLGRHVQMHPRVLLRCKKRIYRWGTWHRRFTSSVRCPYSTESYKRLHAHLRSQHQYRRWQCKSPGCTYISNQYLRVISHYHLEHPILDANLPPQPAEQGEEDGPVEPAGQTEEDDQGEPEGQGEEDGPAEPEGQDEENGPA